MQNPLTITATPDYLIGIEQGNTVLVPIGAGFNGGPSDPNVGLIVGTVTPGEPNAGTGTGGGGGASNFSELGGVPGDNAALAAALAAKADTTTTDALAADIALRATITTTNLLAADIATKASTTTTDALAADIALKADAATMTTLLADKESIDNVDTIRQALQAQIDQKFDSTDIPSQATAEAGLDNATVMTPLRTAQAIAALATGGTSVQTMPSNLLDARSVLLLPGQTNFTVMGPSKAAPSLTTGTYFLSALGSTATTYWIGGIRGRMVAATTTANSRAVFTWNTAFAFPQSTATEATWRAVYTFASADALTSCRNFVGFVRTLETITASVEVSATATGKIGFGTDSTDTNLQLFVGNTKTDLGASFPAHGDRTNPYRIELDFKAGAEHGIDWTVTHIESGANTSGTIAGASVPTSGDLTFWMLRDCAANTGTTAAIETSGLATGGFTELVTGSSAAADTAATREVTTAATIISTDVNATVRVNTATSVALTLPTDSTLALTAGRATLSFFIKGVGVPTITADGTTIRGTPPTLVQYDTLVLNHTGDANTWSYA